MTIREIIIDPDWTPFEEAYMPAGVLEIGGFTKVYKNSRYTVFAREVPSDNPGPLLVHLSIKRNDKSHIHDWRDLQRIKNEILGAEWEGCELYPAESRLVDTSNQMHLWCFQPPVKFPWGFNERCVAETGPNSLAKQRPFENPPNDLEAGRQLLDRQAQELGASDADSLIRELQKKNLK